MTSANGGLDSVVKVDRAGRMRFSREQREALLDAFEHSGMGGAAFAREHGVKYQTFATWVQKRREQAQPGSGALTLAEVVVKEEVGASLPGPAGLRVELPGGARLEVTDRAQLGLAVELLRALGVRSGC